MASSDAEIVNIALSYLGEARITSLSDNSNPAKIASRIYAATRDDLLRSTPWNFAAKRATLSLLADAPDFGFLHQYQLPNDCLFVLALNDDQECGDPGDTFKVEGRMLLTNESTANIRYTAQITDPAQFDAKFVETFAQKLASEMADALTGSTSRAQFHMQKFDAKLQESRTVDGQEGSPDLFTDNSLIDVR